MNISFDLVQASDPDVYAALQGEEQRQREGIELIPSENYAFPEVYATNGSVFANKYSEGYPGRRYYGGQRFTDRIETLAVERAKAANAPTDPNALAPVVDAAKAKWWSAQVQNDVLDACVQLWGGYGYMNEYRVARAWADARVSKIWAGSNEIMKELIGRDLGL